MGVDVNETRREDFARGVDLTLSASRNMSHLHDAIANHGDVARERGLPCAIDDHGVADDQGRPGRS